MAIRLGTILIVIQLPYWIKAEYSASGTTYQNLAAIDLHGSRVTERPAFRKKLRLTVKAFASLLLLNQLLLELAGECLMRYPRGNLGRFCAAGGCDGQDLSLNLEGSRVGPPVKLDVDRMA